MPHVQTEETRMTERCWCCRPIGPSRPETLSPKTAERLIAEANEMVRLYYEVHPEERPLKPF
jgi:hypothetical protein